MNSLTNKLHLKDINLSVFSVWINPIKDITDFMQNCIQTGLSTLADSLTGSTVYTNLYLQINPFMPIMPTNALTL